ncbi:hypothetical protein DFJ74DRAFT_715515 [Hyaloraphidium curvatum]|nr:hypothetical protein DFJ74DRAFT_715515 [Hyaloraphidium curvatum]
MDEDEGSGPVENDVLDDAAAEDAKPAVGKAARRGARVVPWPDFLTPVAPGPHRTLDNELLSELRSRVRDAVYARDPAAGDMADILLSTRRTEPELVWKLGTQVLRVCGRSREDGERRAARWLLHVMSLRMQPQMKQDVLLELAVSLAASGQVEEALRQLQSYLGQEPYAKNAMLHGHAGLLYYKLWRQELAGSGEEWSLQPEFSQAVALEDESPRAQELRQNAVEAFKSSLGLDVRNDLFVAHLVQLLELEKQHAEIVALLCRFIEKDPANILAYRHYFSFLHRHRDEVGFDSPSAVEWRLAYFHLDPAADLRFTLLPLFEHWNALLSQPREHVPDPDPDDPMAARILRFRSDLDARAVFVEKMAKIELLLEHLDFANSPPPPTAFLPPETDGDPLLAPFSDTVEWAWANLADCIRVIRAYDPRTHSRMWEDRRAWWPAFHLGPTSLWDRSASLVTYKCCAAYMAFPDLYRSSEIRTRLAELGPDAGICARYGIEPGELLDPIATAEQLLQNQKRKRRRLLTRYVALDSDSDASDGGRDRLPDDRPKLSSDDRTWVLAALEDVRRVLSDSLSLEEHPGEHPVLSERAFVLLLAPHLRQFRNAFRLYDLGRASLLEKCGINVLYLEHKWIEHSHPDRWAIVERLKEAQADYLRWKETLQHPDLDYTTRNATAAARKEAKAARAAAGRAVLKRVVDYFGLEAKAFEEEIGIRLSTLRDKAKDDK